MTKAHWFLIVAFLWNALLAVYNTGNSNAWMVVNALCAAACAVLFFLTPTQRPARRIRKEKP